MTAMAGKSRRRAAPISEAHDESGKKPIGIIVRRGALRRYDQLKKKEAELPVAVTWDRRLGDRRQISEGTPADRRASDRRKAPPFTWELADFVVVVPEEDKDKVVVPDEDKDKKGSE
jgi:hypothetical protein